MPNESIDESREWNNLEDKEYSNENLATEDLQNNMSSDEYVMGDEEDSERDFELSEEDCIAKNRKSSKNKRKSYDLKSTKEIIIKKLKENVCSYDSLYELYSRDLTFLLERKTFNSFMFNEIDFSILSYLH